MLRKIRFFVLCAALVLSFYVSTTVAYAVPALSILRTEHQPTGETFKARLQGDEWFSYTVTEYGDLVVKESDGFWYYQESSPTGVQKSLAKYAVDTKPLNALGVGNVPALRESKLNAAMQPQTPTSLMQSAPSFAPKFTSAQRILPVTAPQKLLVILVQFSDTSLSTTEASWSNAFFGTTGKTVRTYYEEVSKGTFYFEPAAESSGTADNGVIKVTLPTPHPNTGDDVDVRNLQLVADALEAADSNVNFSSFDTNFNGYIDYNELHIMTVIAGFEAASTYSTPSVWAHRWSFPSGTNVRLDNKILSEDYHGGYTQMGELLNGGGMATIGTACHELGHDIGLPDLYDTDDTNGASDGVGIHSLMGSGNWGFETGEIQGTTPTHLDAWSKIALGFATPTTTSSGTFNVKSAIKYATDAFVGDMILKIPTMNPKQYFLVENRQFTGFDAGLQTQTNNSGIAIWHIDENVINNNMETNSVNDNETHKGVDLEEANEVSYGISYDGRTTGYSQLDDCNSKSYYYENFYYLGNNTKFTSTTTPNSKLYDGTDTNVFLSIPGASADSMQVKVSRAPVAMDDNYNVIAGRTLTITQADLLSNDTDADGDILISSDIIPPIDNTKGTLTANYFGDLTFTAGAGKSGTVSFSYQVTDGIATSNYATVTITIAHSVSFSTNGGSGIPTQGVNHNDKVTIPAQPTRPNYSFVGWYIDPTLTIPYDFNTPVTNDLILYAKWGYQVAFYSQGGSDVNSITADANSIISKPADPARPGYEFGGWYKDVACTDDWAFSTDTVTANTILYAKWTVKVYTITYDYQGATGGNSEVSKSVTFNTAVGALPTPTYGALNFVGWFTASNGGGQLYTSNTIHQTPAPITLYAYFVYPNLGGGLGGFGGGGGVPPAIATETEGTPVSISATFGNTTSTVIAAKFNPATLTVTASFNSQAAQNLIDTALKAKTGKQNAIASIQFGSVANAMAVNVELPRDELKKMAAAKITLQLNSVFGTISLGTTELSSIARSASSGIITLGIEKLGTEDLTSSMQAKVKSSPVYRFELSVGNTPISKISGSAKISVPYTLKPGEKAKAITVYYVDNKGALRSAKATFNSKTGMLSFSVSRF